MLAELLSQLQEQQADSANPTTGLTETLELSWNSLDEFTQQIGMMLSLFAPTPIPQAMLEQVVESALDKDINGDGITTACNTLIQRFLLQHIDATTYRLHNPIRAYLQTKLDQSTQSDRYKQAFTRGMVAFAKRLSDPPPIAECDAFGPAISHIAEAAITWQAWLDDDSIIFPFFCLGRFYAAQGALDQAAQWYEQGLLVARKRLGNEHLAIAANLTHLANLYCTQYRYQEAESLYQEASQLLDQLLGEEHLAVSISLNNLAAVFETQQRYDETNLLHLRSSAIGEQHLGTGSPEVTQNYDKLTESDEGFGLNHVWLKNNFNARMSGELAKGLWHLLGFVVIMHFGAIIFFSWDLINNSNTKNTSERIAQFENAISIISGTAKTLYALLAPLATAATGYYLSSKEKLKTSKKSDDSLTKDYLMTEGESELSKHSDYKAEAEHK